MQGKHPLIRELNELFLQDPDIDELGVIFTVPPPSTPQRETSSTGSQEPAPSEPHFLLQQHKLGVSVHSVHPLVNEAREAFPDARRAYLRAREEGISGGGAEGKKGEEWTKAAETLLCVTRALLLINADYGSAWNARKRLVSDGVYGDVRGEMKLLDLIFTKHAKSPNAWAHRRWCWRNEGGFRREHGGSWTPLELAEELEVCRRVAELYPKNYYAWTQRSWVVLRLVGSATAAAGMDEHAKAVGGAKELLKQEISFVDKWLTSHVSDHSALNHRKNVVSALAAVSSASSETGLGFVESERTSNSAVIIDYPGHESLWCYRRFVCQSFLVIAPRASLTRASGPLQHVAEDDTSGARSAPLEAERAKGEGVSKDAAVSCAPPPLAGGDLYDWPGFNDAVTDWYEGCLRQDAEEQKLGEEEVDEEVDGEGEPVPGDGSRHGGEAVGSLPGAPVGGGMLADFLGRESRFALKCACDKGAWQFRQQRRHALAYLAFVSYATDRILRRYGLDKSGIGVTGFSVGAVGPDDKGCSVFDGVGGRVGGGSITGGCVNYCEVTGAPKLRFPLERAPEERSSAVEGLAATAQDAGGCAGATPEPAPGSGRDEGAMRALRRLNSFVAALRRADVVLETDSDCRKDGMRSGGATPYAMET